MNRNPQKGRGATASPPPRFLSLRVLSDEDPATRSGTRTTFTPEHAKTLLRRNNSPDVPFRVSVNPYQGCEHGCTYCFARPSHAYLDLSPGLDFETRIFYKKNAADLLQKEFRKANYQPEPIVIGANTDCYQPAERQFGITRDILEVCRDFRHPVSAITKSALVTRDLDLWSNLAADGLANVFVSVTTLDPKLAGILEPRASTPARRLEAIDALRQAGVPVGVLVAPVIPAINDGELEKILEAVAQSGAQGAGMILMRLPHELKDLITDWLQEHFPDRAGRALNLLRECHGGDLYRSEFGTRMSGTGPYATMLQQRFALARRRFGLGRGLDNLSQKQFQPPPQVGDQLGLFR